MHVKQLELYNFQGIKSFEGSFDGNVYLVTGENELGKSTLLKALSILLTGNRDEVLRNGADKGFAKAIVGNDGKDYEVKLSMTKANPRGTLTIKSDGVFSDRVSMLQQIFGYTDFDASEFSAWSDTAEGRRKQVEMVMSLLPREAQNRIREIDSEVLSTKEERKTANATLKEQTTLAESYGDMLEPGDREKYANPIDMADLLKQQAEQSALDEKAKTVRERKEQREKTLQDIPGRRKRLQEDFNKAMKALNQEEKDNKEKLNNCNDWLKEYEERETVNIDDQVTNASTHNEKHKTVESFNIATENQEHAEKEVDRFEKKLLKLSDERNELIKGSQLPIPGLTFTSEGLELNGIPFENGKVSDSQIMEVATRIIIAKNPTVKVFRVGRGESLGGKKLQALVDFANENGYQGFIEQVARGQNDLRVEEYIEK